MLPSLILFSLASFIGVRIPVKFIWLFPNSAVVESKIITDFVALAILPTSESLEKDISLALTSVPPI